MLWALILVLLISIVQCYIFPNQRLYTAHSRSLLDLSIYNVMNQPDYKNTNLNIFKMAPLLMAKPTNTPAPRRGPKQKKVKDDVIQVNGKVVESLPNAMFRVEIDTPPTKSLVLCTISGKIRKNFVRIIVGDSVLCELSAYDLTRGRITFRNK